MGNKGSSEPSMVQLPTAQREENPYDHSLPSRTSNPVPAIGNVSSTTSSSPRMLERRSMTVVHREKSHDKDQRGTAALRRLSASETSTSYSAHSDPLQRDDLQAHIMDRSPKEGEQEVELGTSIVVFFDKDVRTVNINKLFEVKCDISQAPVKGLCSYDGRQFRAEFVPLSTLYPNAHYTVHLQGRAVTTTQCSISANIKNAQLHFATCDPPPKNIGIKMKGQKNEVEKIQLANYYDLYNSLVVWSTRRWGCSGEHVTAMYVEREDKAKPQQLKADHDVLRLKENEVVIVEIKD